MNLSLKKYSLEEKLFHLNLILLLIGLVYSKFLISASSIILTLWAISSLIKKPQSFKSFIKTPVFAVVSLIFLAFLFSGINSSNTSEWIHQVKLKLPFLFLPWVFFCFRERLSKHYHYYIISFVLIVFLSSWAVLFAYLADFNAINDAIGRGQAIPTPVDHIKYSLYAAFACLSAIIFLWEKHFNNRNINLGLGFIALSLFVFLHILAVRSGLFVFYLSFLCFLVLAFFNKNHSSKKILLLLASLIIIPYFAYKTIPSLERKVGYMKYDIQMYLTGEGKAYSDSERLYSYKVGFELFRKCPIVGVGIGDLLDESEKGYQKQFGLSLKKYPHNMYLFLLSGLGILGFGLCMIGFLYPSWYFRKNLNSFYLCFTLIVLISFFVENTIQRSYSTAFYLIFSLLGICYMNDNLSDHPNS